MKIINNINELNNLAVKIDLNGKKYNSTIVYLKNELYLKVNMTKNIDEWRNIQDGFSVINGKILSDNTEISFINCYTCGHESTSDKTGRNISLAIVKLIVDRIIYYKKIDSITNNYFSKVEINLKNISEFFTTKIYEYDFVNNNLKINIHNDNYNLKDGKEICINLAASINDGRYEFKVKRNEIISVSSTNLMSYKQIIDIIYKIKSFLILLNKRNICFEKIILYNNNNKSQLIDCYEEPQIEKRNSDLDIKINNRCIKYKDINDFGKIFENYRSNYSKLSDLIEMYYDAISNKFPNQTRLLNSINMIENISVEFFDKQALKLTKKRNSKKTAAEFVDRIRNLITNVNCIFSFSPSEIDFLSNKITDARTWIVHHKKKNKKLDYDQQFRFYSFIEDIILLNIYKIIGIDITIIDKNRLIYLDLLYTKKDLLK